MYFLLYVPSLTAAGLQRRGDGNEAQELSDQAAPNQEVPACAMP